MVGGLDLLSISSNIRDASTPEKYHIYGNKKKLILNIYQIFSRYLIKVIFQDRLTLVKSEITVIASGTQVSAILSIFDIII